MKGIEQWSGSLGFGEVTAAGQELLRLLGVAEPPRSKIVRAFMSLCRILEAIHVPRRAGQLTPD